MGNMGSRPVDDDGDGFNLARMLNSIGKGDDVVPQSRELTGEEHRGVDDVRALVLEAKHKIFLSHSGVQKSFVDELSADLMRRDRHPFFDKLRESLPVGEKFPPHIFDAIRQCEVGVVVLSEEFFTRSKWPMLELAAMVEEYNTRATNRRIKIIPVYYSITRERCQNPDVQVEWMRKHWRKWEEEDKHRIGVERTDAEKWKKALKEIGPFVGFVKRDLELDRRFRARIVVDICKIVRPRTNMGDDSRVEGKTRLFEEISERIYKGAQPMDLEGGVHVVGLYGVGGVGKTTACKVLCKELCGEYQDKVCHVEFGSAREEELLQKVLRKLSDLEVERMENLNVDECHGHLKTRLPKERVFLALDNVSDESKEQAKSLLRANFGDGSVVLVTARSRVQLQRLGVAKEKCFAMPDLEVEEAKSLFWNCADLKQNEVGEEFVKTCLRRCYFTMSSGRKHYHPLALKVLGTEVGDMIRGGKDERAVLSRIRDFNLSRQREHPVFSILRSSFDSLKEEEEGHDQLLFLDIALKMGVNDEFSEIYICTAMEWLCMMHGKEHDEVEDMLDCLQRRSLLQSFGADEYGRWGFHMHDLWREFAKEEMKVGKLGDRRRVYEGEECRGSVDLREYAKLEAVKLTYYGKDIVAVDVRELKHLRSLEIKRSIFGATEVSGLGTLERLRVLRLCNAASNECIAKVGLLTNLHYVDLSYFRGDRLPDMSQLTCLQTLNLAHSVSLQCINLQNLPKLAKLYCYSCFALRSVDISGCGSLRSLTILAGLHDLEELNISSFPSIRSLEGLGSLSSLRKLDITGCSSIEKLDVLKYLEKLEELRARDCERLAMLPECKLPNLRVLDIESSKVPIGEVKEFYFPILALEFEEAKALFLKRAYLKMIDVGEEFVKTCLSRLCFPTGQSLLSDGQHYYPLAAMVLGSEVGDMIRGGKDGSAVLSRMSDVNLSRQREHPVFSVLGSSFDFLPEEDQLLFLDIAFVNGVFTDFYAINICTRMEWLCVVHGKDRDAVNDMLERLKRRSLLESFGADKNGEWKFYMYDLWREFAKQEMKVLKFEDRRLVYEGEKCTGGLDLREYRKLEAVNLTYYGKDIVAVDVRELKHLRSLEIRRGFLGATEVSGLGTLERLRVLRLCKAASDECIAEVGLLTNLHYVDLSYFLGGRLPDMSQLTCLQTLNLAHSVSLQCINLQNLPKLAKLYCYSCFALRSVDISGCGSLRKLDITGCSLIENLDDLIYLEKLEELRASNCERLAMLPECRLPNLRVLDIESVKIPIGFATLGDACLLPRFWEGAESNGK